MSRAVQTDIGAEFRRIAEAHQHIAEMVSGAFQSNKRITKDEMIAILSWNAAAAQSLRLVGMAVFPPRGEA